jgi:hypothetical protein
MPTYPAGYATALKLSALKTFYSIDCGDHIYQWVDVVVVVVVVVVIVGGVAVNLESCINYAFCLLSAKQSKTNIC